MIQIRIAGDMLADGISVYVSRKGDGIPRQILHVAQGGRWTEWDDLDPHGAVSEEPAPTIRLTDDQGRALLDALLRHYQGSGDYHTLRADYLAERKRVDDLIANMGQLVIIQAQR
jgi:hypothetical protein